MIVDDYVKLGTYLKMSYELMLKSSVLSFNMRGNIDKEYKKRIERLCKEITQLRSDLDGYFITCGIGEKFGLDDLERNSVFYPSYNEDMLITNVESKSKDFKEEVISELWMRGN